MNSKKTRDDRHRHGLSQVEYVCIIGAVALVVLVAVARLGNTTSDTLQQTADSVADPSRLLQSPLISGGNPSATADDTSPSGDDNGESAADDDSGQDDTDAGQDDATAPGNGWGRGRNH